MPEKFKALATIGAWVLFVMGLLSFVWAFVFWFSSPVDFSEAGIWAAGDSAAVMGAVMVILSICAMRLRGKME
jgi:hypothetical protein